MSKWSDLWDAGLAVKPYGGTFVTTEGTKYYRVHMLGWARFLFWPRINIKRIDIIGNGVNLWFVKWGEFYTSYLPGYWDRNIQGPAPVLLSYDQLDNSWFIRRIRDWIRGIPGGDYYPDIVWLKLRAERKCYICQFRYDFTGMRILGRLGERRIAWFLLERIDNYHGGDS